jgi:transposase
MRKIVDVLRLSHEGGLSHREIARVVNASPTTVGEILRRAKLVRRHLAAAGGRERAVAGGAAVPAGGTVEPESPRTRLAGCAPRTAAQGRHARPALAGIQSRAPVGYRYSGFCAHYRRWVVRLSVSLRQTHAPGEKLFIDYAGPTVPITDPMTGEIRQAAIFLAVLGASNYTYCEATWSQSLPDWIGSHVRTFEHLGGVHGAAGPDNLKSGVTTPCFYDPELNPTYRDLATHYGTAVLPARPYRPKDKAKVEAAVLLVERWVLARLRHQRFFSLDELNRSMAELMAALNSRPFKKLPGCRQSAFAELDRPALRPLPVTRYEFAEWKVVRVGIDYHVEVVGHYYSVPYRFAREKVDSRLTATTVDCSTAARASPVMPGTTPRSAHHRRCAHDPGPPGGPGLECAAPARLGRAYRAACRCRRAEPSASAPTSAAGLPGVPGHPALGQGLRGRPPGSGLRAGHRHRRDVLQQPEIDPEERSGQEARRQRPGPDLFAPRTRQSAWPRLLPLKETLPC